MTPAKILAVDDEADFELLIRQRFRRQIRSEEFAFRFAHHGEEALNVLAEEPDIGLLLLDIKMPVMDGLTLLAELRPRRLTSKIESDRLELDPFAASAYSHWRGNEGLQWVGLSRLGEAGLTTVD